MSKVFEQSLQELGIKPIKSSAYHPESQGALERYHQALKTMICKYCHEFETDWDKGIHFLLFATRETPNDSLGFSPFELIYGHEVRGPLKLIKDGLFSDVENKNMLNYVSCFQRKTTKVLGTSKI